jgi:phosphopantetheinyl transferase
MATKTGNTGMIHIAFAQWDAVDNELLRGALRWLNDSERSHASRFRDQISRMEWLGGRILLRWLLSCTLSGKPGQWLFEREPSGRLIISHENDGGCSISISRAPGIAVAAVARGCSVGVAVEPVTSSRIAEDLLTAYERATAANDPVALTNFWCMREAMAKGCGAGAAWAMEPTCFLSASSYASPSGDIWSSTRLCVPHEWTGAVAAQGAMPEVFLINAVTAGFPIYNDRDQYRHISHNSHDPWMGKFLTG